MNKSTIGMIIVVAMVLAKAFIVDNESVQVQSKQVTAADLLELGVEDFDFSKKNSNDKLIASAGEFNLPELMAFKNVESNSASTRVIEEEVIPMDDFHGNTGYGFWLADNESQKTSSLIDAQPERQGRGESYPLDNGSTISDDFSRLFQRNPGN
ncbi:hypothetical protein K6119_10285 [Paracrocinitomix mangrovi]|uniref:hypothetical protein n=1 Tax=Paracrocinitomix mangrovi TaxID=2862509 RepID=UPI001C8D4D07|nr:hypothetical protein [Paracrocinitomix mangrovi]UKN00121.1 hypothetical protein K6119_10285 [Paracrocinitomix mangrovi]